MLSLEFIVAEGDSPGGCEIWFDGGGACIVEGVTCMGVPGGARIVAPPWEGTGNPCCGSPAMGGGMTIPG